MDSVADVHASRHGDSLEGGDGHVRVRPVDCRCLADGGCGDVDECCIHDDFPGAVICPCASRVSTAGVFEVRRSMHSASATSGAIERG